MINIKPLGKNILVEMETQESVLAPEAIEKDFGIVTAIGDEVEKTGRIKVGDKLAFLKWGVRKIESGEEKYSFISEDSPWLIGIVTEDGKTK